MKRPDEDRHAAALLEELLHLVEPVLGDLQPVAVAQQPRPAELAARRVRGQVARHRARPDDADQHQERDLPLAGDHAADDHGRLPRRHEADERAGLEEREDADHDVGPGTERAPDVEEQLLEVGQLHEPDADCAGAGHDHPAGRLRPSAQAVAADEQEPGHRQRSEQPAPLHAATTSPNAAPAGSAASPPVASAASRAAASVGKTPKTVGPEPETMAALAPAARRSASGRSTAGSSARAAGSRSLTAGAARRRGLPPRVRRARCAFVRGRDGRTRGRRRRSRGRLRWQR